MGIPYPLRCANRADAVKIDEAQRMWYELTNIGRRDPRHISARVRVPPESRWFRGHFPGEAILPGVALIAMVRETVCCARGDRTILRALKRVRFKHIVRPGDVLEISVSLEPGKTPDGSFQVTAGDEVVCSGRVFFEETSGVGGTTTDACSI